MAQAPAQAVLGCSVRFSASARESLSQAAAAVLITPWPEYAAIAPEWIAGGKLRVFIDCWRQLKPDAFEKHCKVVHLGHQDTIAAAVCQEAAE
jgi:hypothetical protein